MASGQLFNVWKVAACGVLWLVGIGRIGLATDIPSPADVNAIGEPSVFFNQSGNGAEIPIFVWWMSGTHNAFKVNRLTETFPYPCPFHIDATAPDRTLFLGSAGRVGMGTTAPDANSQVEVRSNSLNGLLLKRTTADSNYLRIENSAGVFRTGVQAGGDTQFGALTPGKGLYLLAGGTGKLLINASGQFSFGNPPPAIPAGVAMMTGTGAHLTIGGAWTNNSSRVAKQDIEPITSDEARETVRALQPVGYRYKTELDERYVGFIAEDVPELVATRDRKGLASMDITAVLTKVVQDQDNKLDQQRQELETERDRNNRLEATVDRQQQLIDSLSKRLVALERKSEREE